VDLLYFQIGGAPYAIPLAAIADVSPAGPIHPVPLSPPAVLGLAERRGRAIAVIDLRFLLDEPESEARGNGNVMRLAGPLQGAALFVPAAVFSGSGTPATEGHVWIDGRLHALLDAEALVKRAATFH
jgi:chemotaxis signal transduction protein